MVCLCSAFCDASRHGGRLVLAGLGGGSGGLLVERAVLEDRSGGAGGAAGIALTGGALTGGRTLDVDVGVGLSPSGAAL